MTLPRSLRRCLLAAVAVVALGTAGARVWAQQAPALPADAMERTGTVDARSDAERAAFAALTCTCGTCPHESLSSCTCGFAHQSRLEIRAMLAQGMTIEQIKTEWVKLHGTDSLAVPSNTGANRLLYVAPLVAIAGAAAFVVVLLGRLRRRGLGSTPGPLDTAETAGRPQPTKRARDEYDEKLDDELSRLDEE